MENNNPSENLSELIIGMRDAYKKGGNAMEFARSFLANKNADNEKNHRFSTMISYDLQAGTYVKGLKKNIQFKEKKHGPQIALSIEPYLPNDGSILEVGVGEATTLFYVIKSLKVKPSKVCGFDLSWSRIKVANEYLSKNGQNAELFVGDMFHIPLAENSIDVVYSSHSLEPNGGSEEILMKECFRVARRAVVFVEPIYEFATPEAKKRMQKHGYIRGLYKIAEKMNCSIKEYKLLEFIETPLNPTGVLTITKDNFSGNQISSKLSDINWICPVTKSPLIKNEDAFFSKASGLAYPILKNIPLLRPENAVVASLYS